MIFVLWVIKNDEKITKNVHIVTNNVLTVIMCLEKCCVLCVVKRDENFRFAGR